MIIERNEIKYNKELNDKVLEKFRNNKKSYYELNTDEIDFNSKLFKQFNDYNFFHCDLNELYVSSESKSEFLNKELINEILEHFQTEYLNYKLNELEQKEVKKYIELRLAKMFNAFLYEDVKLVKMLEIISKSKHTAKIFCSRNIDKIIGVDMIVILNNSNIFYIHSLKNSSQSLEYFESKINKEYKVKNVDNKEFKIDRKELYNLKYHKKLLDNSNINDMEVAEKQLETDIIRLLNELNRLNQTEKLESIKEFLEIKEILEKVESEDKIYKYLSA